MEKLDHVFLDVDGTLTDGKIYYTENGDEEKAFNIKDGLVLGFLTRINKKVVIITGRTSAIVLKRMSELGITECYQGVTNKSAFFEKYIKDHNVELENCVYVGDDLNDLAIMRMISHSACPKDACKEIKDLAEYVSVFPGGCGAVRDIIEYYMRLTQEWDMIIRYYE